MSAAASTAIGLANSPASGGGYLRPQVAITIGLEWRLPPARAIVIYRMRVIERSPDRIVVSVVNASPIRTFLVTLFAPGELQTTYFLDRLGPNEWGYFGLWGITTGLLTGGHTASSINRAMALYRHFAGIPTDLEPPAAR